jgi:hypothetical protein
MERSLSWGCLIKMTTIKLSPFPTEIGQEINTPNIGYLLTMPMFDMCPIDDFMKRASNFQKTLVKLAPLRNDRENILITSKVQFLFPNYSPTQNKHGNTFEWHMDGSGSIYDRFINEHMDVFHLFISECNSRTEFNTNELVIDISDCTNIHDFNKSINNKDYNFNGKKIEPNRFVTFSNHVHRPTNPEGYEFRFFFSIIESNFMKPVEHDKRFPKENVIFKGSDELLNIEQRDNGEIHITVPQGEYERVLSNGL